MQVTSTQEEEQVFASILSQKSRYERNRADYPALRKLKRKEDQLHSQFEANQESEATFVKKNPPKPPPNPLVEKDEPTGTPARKFVRGEELRKRLQYLHLRRGKKIT